MKKWPVLSVSHTLWMTHEERYKLVNGETVEIVGTSTPVWFYKGNTSEPAQELFCRYTVTSMESQTYIQHRMEGYEVNVPKMVIPADVPQEVWDNFTDQDREDFLRMVPNPSGVKDLLDFRDGGIGWFYFRQYTKIQKHDNTQVHLIHYVELKDMKILVKTLV